MLSDAYFYIVSKDIVFRAVYMLHLFIHLSACLFIRPDIFCYHDIP